MKAKLLFTIVLLSAFAFSPYKEEVIVWKEGVLLQPKDFKGTNPNDGGVISTTCDIDKNITDHNDSASVIIEAVFLPLRSWRRKGGSEADLLMHEQKHFDIAELYARKLRKYIKEEEFNDIDELTLELNHYHKKIMEELDHYQDKYDTKTDHSMNGPKQRKWNKKITSELNKMDYYKDQKLTVHFKKLNIPASVSK